MCMKRMIAIAACVWLATVAAFASGEREELAFSYPSVRSLIVRSEFLDVEVRAEAGFPLSMSADLPWDSFFEPRGYRVLHELSGSHLDVWVERDGWFFNNSRGGTLVFSVPRDISMQIESVSGSLRVEGIDGGDVRAESVSGRMDLREIRGALDASSVSGEIAVDRFEGRLAAKTVSGSISGRRVTLTDDSDFSSTSGSIDIGIDTPLEDIRFDLSTVSGRLTVGTLRAARGLRTGSGAVTIRGSTISGSQAYR